jgi:hypothetical protein
VVGAERRVDLPQPTEGRLDIDTAAVVGDVDADRHPHHVAHLGDARGRHAPSVAADPGSVLGVAWEIGGATRPPGLRNVPAAA